MKYYKSTTELNCGIDLHARQMYVCVQNREGDVLVHRNIRDNDFEFFLKLVEPYRHSLTVVAESTFNWYWLADACFDARIEFVLAHALYLKHIHGGKNKNDRVDAEKLAHLLRTNLIPPAYVYPAEYRPVRTLLRKRMSYVWNRATLKTQLSMGQTAEGLIPAKGKTGDRDDWEKNINAQFSNPLHRTGASCDMQLVRVYDEQIDLLEQTLLSQTKNRRRSEYELLKTVPGIGPILAMTILYEIDRISRFKTVKDFVSYSRLVKGSVASAGVVKGTAGAKMGNAYLRWAFGEAAIRCKSKHSLLRPYAEMITNKHGKFKGNAILAAKLGRAVYFMLQKHRPFDAERLISTSI